MDSYETNYTSLNLDPVAPLLRPEQAFWETSPDWILSVMVPVFLQEPTDMVNLPVTVLKKV